MKQVLLSYIPLSLTVLFASLLTACGGNSSSDKPSFTGLWEDRVSWTEEISGNISRSSRSGASIEPLLIEDFGSYFLVTRCRSRTQERLEVVDSRITLPALLATPTTPARPAVSLLLENNAQIFGEHTYLVNGLARNETHEINKLSTLNQFDDGSMSFNLATSTSPETNQLAANALTDTCAYSQTEETYDIPLEELKEIIDDPTRRASDVYFNTKTLTITGPTESNDFLQITLSFRDELSVRIVGNGETYALEEASNLFSVHYSQAEEFTGSASNNGVSGRFTFDSYNFIEEISFLPTTGSFDIVLAEGSVVNGDFEVTQ